MTTAPLSPERLAEIERLVSHGWGWWTSEIRQARAAIPELLAEVRRLQIDVTEIEEQRDVYRDRSQQLASELGASHDEIDNLNGYITRANVPALRDRLANAERDLAETNLVLEQQDRDLAAARAKIDDLWRQLARNSWAHNVRVATQIDEGKARIAELEAMTERLQAEVITGGAALAQGFLDQNRLNARIAALEAGLREALSGALNDEARGREIEARLRALADGGTP